MTSTRHLAAILAADVAGYSRLMGRTRKAPYERQKVLRRHLADPKIKEHRGRIVKTTGDGLLVEFPSVVDAVRCAAEAQRGMIDRKPDVPDERRIRFRSGSTSATSSSRTGHFRRRRQCRGAAGSARRARRHLHLGDGARPHSRQLPSPFDDRGAERKEHRAPCTCLCIAPRGRCRHACIGGRSRPRLDGAGPSPQ